MVFVSGLAIRTYLLIIGLALASVILITNIFLQANQERLTESKQLQLFKVAIELERKIDKHMFAAQVSSIDSLPLSQDQKASLLNKWIQPTLMEIADKYPGYGLGVYSIQLERVVGIGPNFKHELLKQITRPEVMEVYTTGQPVFSNLSKSCSLDGKDVLSLAYPIQCHGEIIGHTWASVKVEDIEHEIRQEFIVIFCYAVVWACVILAAMSMAFKYLEKGLSRLADFVKQPTDKEKLVSDFPELQPLIDEICRLRESLENEYQSRELVQRELDRLDRLNLVGEMAAGIGHEVRNPMTTVRGYLQLFQNKPIFADYSDQIKLMIDELDRANGIISEFLSLAKDKTVVLKRGNLNRAINSMLLLLQPEALRLGHEIKTELSFIPDIEFDEKEVRQLVLNLVHNAFEAMQASGIVTIRTYQENDRVILAIADTGPGICQKVLDKLWTPFVTTKENGTGLGLSICYRIALRHKAEINVNSTEHGTTFNISFPTLPQVE